MIRRPTAAFIAILLLTTLLSACSQNPQATTSGPGGNSWTKHGVLRIVNLSEPDNMNPVVGNQQTEVDISMFWAGYLFNWSDQNELVPELATVAPTLRNGGISKDGLSVTYHLRKGVKWQDGAPFSADDVIFTYQAINNPANFVSSTVGYDKSYISGIQKIDDYTIVVHLAHRWAPFVNSFLTMSSTPYPVLPKHILGKYPNINHVQYDTIPVGTGPFKVVEYQKGSLIRMVANRNYWRGPPKLKEVDFSIVPDENTILAQLESHDQDMEYYAPTAQAPQLNALQGYHIYLTPFTQYGEIAFNLQHPPLDDVMVRRALTYATDFRTLLHDITHDVYVPGNSDQPPFIWAYNPHIKTYPYDIEEANTLLAQDGWVMGPDGYRHKNGKTLEIELTGVIGRADQIRQQAVLQEEWKKAGVKADIKNYITSMFFATYGAGGILQTGKFDAAILSWINGIDPDDSTLFMCDQFPPKGQNSFRFCDPELDAQERVALNEYDISVRKAAYDKIQDILADQQPQIVTWYVQRQDVVNSDLKNYKPAHAVTTFWNTWEWEI